MSPTYCGTRGEIHYRVLAKSWFDEDGHEWLDESSPPLMSLDAALRCLSHRRGKGLDHHLEERIWPDGRWHRSPLDALLHELQQRIEEMDDAEFERLRNELSA